MELNTARVFVDDIGAAKAFYFETLSLPLKIDGEDHGFCVFRSGGAELVVEVVSADAPSDERILVGRFTGLSFTVQDIQAKYTELLAKGVAFTGAPERQPWGGTLATFKDTSGNELQLVQGSAA